MIRVLIADDHAVVREGIKRMIDNVDDMVVVAEASDGPALLAHLSTQPGDAIVMDLSMPGMSGLDLLQELRRHKPSPPVVVLSMYPADQYAVRTLAAGASSFLHKGGPPDELIRALRTVVTGRRYVTPEVAELLAAHVDEAADRPPHEKLSNREFQVLCQLASGKSVSAIAAELSLSVKTVSTFRSRIIEKLGFRNNADITRYALERGLLK